MPRKSAFQYFMVDAASTASLQNKYMHNCSLLSIRSGLEESNSTHVLETVRFRRAAFAVVTRAAQSARAHFSHIIVSKDSPLRAFHGLKLQSPILRLWRLKLHEFCMTINLFCYPSRPPCSFLRLRQSMVWVRDVANDYFC